MRELAAYGLGEREIAALTRRTTRTVYIIGDSDTGKTTLAAAVARRLARTRRTALVDLDAGQATLGLPTTFGWKLCGARRAGEGMYFVGTTSPTGYFDLWVEGAAELVGRARRRARTVVIDTCGLARGPEGRRLHERIADAVRPDVVVAIEREGELAELLDGLGRAGRRVIRASVPAGVRRRSRARRRSYRCARFRAYFQGGRELCLSLDDVAVVRPRPDPVGRIASLRDEAGVDAALGIVRKVDSARGTITLWTPLRRRTAVRAVVLGSMRIARDGRQLARNI